MYESQKKLAQRNGSAPSRIETLEKRCRALTKERQCLRLENAQLRQERDDFRKAVMALMVEPFEFDKKALLAQVGKQQPLEELLAELEANAS
jgi:regulator of replication initiation timing